VGSAVDGGGGRRRGKEWRVKEERESGGREEK